ncbi:unnamed protein product [Parajaminaea phylloscopi]
MPTALTNSAEAGPSKRPGSPQSNLPPILPLSAFPDPGQPIHVKPKGFEFYREVLNSPRLIVAPMVSGSELPWRLLSRRLGADLCYSPMINCRSLVENLRAKGKTAKERVRDWFDAETGEEGHGDDKQLIVQLAGNDPDVVLEAARTLEDHCLAIDLNLGCPQHIAKRGFYGSYLQEDWPLIFRIVNTLHINLKVPVTAKMRVFPDVERTVAYAQMLAHAGAQIVTVHGRTREQKGHKTGLADWQKIKAVKEALNIPVIANGNILYAEDITACQEATGADGIMSAEGNLYNPLLFASPDVLKTLPEELVPHRNQQWGEFAYIPALAHAYLDEVVRCKTKTDGTAVKGHIFKLCRPALEKHPELRAEIGKSHMRYDEGRSEGEVDETAARERIVRQFRAVVTLLDEKLKVDRVNPKYATAPADVASSSLAESSVQERYVPHWLAQPYFRPAHVSGDIGKAESKAPRGSLEHGRPPSMVDPDDIQSAGEKRTIEGDSTKGEDEKRLRQALSDASQHKDAANSLFVAGNYDEALSVYQDALACLPPRSADDATRLGDGDQEDAVAGGARQATSNRDTLDEQDRLRELTRAEELEEERLARLSPSARAQEDRERELREELNTLRVTLHSNMAASEMKLNRWERGSKACDEALRDDPSHLKSLNRRATCLEQIGTWSSLSSAHADLTRLCSHSQLPAAMLPTIKSSLSRVSNKRDEAAQREKDEMMGKLKGLGDAILGNFGLSTNNFKFEQNQQGGWGMKFQR